MKVLHRLEEVRGEQEPIVLTIGSFDGIHRGHRALIDQARTEARAVGGRAWVLTFDPHPLKVLRPEAAPALLTSTDHKLALLAHCDVEGVVLLPFTPELAQKTPEEFLEELRQSVPALTSIVVGKNWRFGRGARGDPPLLRALAARLNLRTTIVEPICWHGSPISSSRIRATVEHGELEAAAEMLGRPFSVMGRVIHGQKRGRALGFPTANVRPENEVKPPAGVYAVRARLDAELHDGAAYLSRDAAVGGEARYWAVEVYLFHFEHELYGRELEIFFLAHLRGDRHFNRDRDLKAQIREDVRQVQERLAAGSDRLDASP